MTHLKLVGESPERFIVITLNEEGEQVGTPYRHNCTSFDQLLDYLKVRNNARRPGNKLEFVAKGVVQDEENILRAGDIVSEPAVNLTPERKAEILAEHKPHDGFKDSGFRPESRGSPQ